MKRILLYYGNHKVVKDLTIEAKNGDSIHHNIHPKKVIFKFNRWK